MSKKTKPVLKPLVWFDHDLENYYIQVELAGVKKEDIELNVSEQSLCVRGSRKDADLLACYYLAHPIDDDKARATYTYGILKIMIPFKEMLKGKKITIE